VYLCVRVWNSLGKNRKSAREKKLGRTYRDSDLQRDRKVLIQEKDERGREGEFSQCVVSNFDATKGRYACIHSKSGLHLITVCM
jgi:hypothetical protein